MKATGIHSHGLLSVPTVGFHNTEIVLRNQELFYSLLHRFCDLLFT